MTSGDSAPDAPERVDDLLAVRAGAGDAKAFGMLYDRYASRVARLLRGFARDESELEDMVHDTFCRLMVALPSYRPQGAFRSWLFTMAMNVGRRASRRAEASATFGEHTVPSPDSRASAGLYPVETRMLAHRLLSLLPESKRLVVVMRIWLDLPYEEIGAILGIPPATARTRMYGALRDLRTLLLHDERKEATTR